MRAFSGAILGARHDVVTPTVARIEGERLFLSSPDGGVEDWHLNSVEIIQVAAGYFEVVAKDRTLSLVVDEPEAFGEALTAERHSTEIPRLEEAGRRSVPGLSLLVKRPKHGLPSLRLGPLLAVLFVVLMVVVAGGSTFGDLIDISTTESQRVLDAPTTEVVVRTFEGSDALHIQPFAVEAPWKVEWSLVGGEGSELIVAAIGASGESVDVGSQQGSGEGQIEFQQGGLFSLDITITAGERWSIRVVEIINPESR